MKAEKRTFFVILAISLTIIVSSFLIMPLFVHLFFPDDSADPIVLMITQFLGNIIPVLLILYFFGKKSGSKYDVYALENILASDEINWKGILLYSLYGIIAFFFVKLTTIFIENLFISLGLLETPVKTIYYFKFGHFALLIIAYAIIPAIYEEFLYRGIYYNSGFNCFTTYLLAVVPFALMHFPLVNIISAFIIGSIFFSIREKKKGIIYLIIAHFVYNLASIIFANYLVLPIEPAYLASKLLVSKEYLIYALISLALALVFLVIIILLSKSKGKPKKRISSKNGWSIATLIVVLLLFIINACLNLLI